MISFPTHWSKLILPQSFAHRHNDLILFKLHLLEMGVTSILQGCAKMKAWNTSQKAYTVPTYPGGYILRPPWMSETWRVTNPAYTVFFLYICTYDKV